MFIVACACTSFASPYNAQAASSMNLVDGVIKHKYLTIQVTSQKKLVSLRPGMTKTQIDRLLGKPNEVESADFKGYAYGAASNILVGYLNERAASIFTTGYETSLNGQFKFGTPWKKVLSKIGQPSKKTDRSGVYVFQLVNGKLKQIYGKAIHDGIGRTDVYTLSIGISPSSNISGISVVQAAFTQAMEDRYTKPDSNKPTFVEEDINGIISGDDRQISLGMTREEVEALFGNPDGNLSYSSVVMDSYDTISIFYREEVVAVILVDPSTDSRVATNKGLSMPADRKEVLRVYGNPTFNNTSSLQYNFEWFGDRLQAMNMFKAIDRNYWQNQKYSLSFVAYESDPNRIEYFILSDSDFRYDEFNIPKPVS
jgi:outer membrane protein assembly factor BamE (lipoprotein component of BamABCDE complex)